MKHIILGFFLLLSLQGFTQTTWDKAGIEQLMTAYFKVSESGEFKKTLDFIHPALFDFAPREMLEKALDQQFNDTMISIQLYGFELDKISKIVKYNKVAYAKVNSDFQMKMVYNESAFDDNDDSEEGGIDLLEMTASLLKSQYGKKNVTADKAKKTIYIKASSEAILIGDKSIGSWKMLENKKNMEKIMDEIVPLKVRKKLKAN